MDDPLRPILYSFRRCPYAIRARMALQAANICCELREVSLSQKPAAMLAISPKATVPVLQLPGGELIEESLAIMRWALQQADPQHWLQGGESQTQALISANDEEFKYWLDRYKYHVRYPQHDQRYYREQAEAFVQTLETRLAAHKAAGLLADKCLLADIAVLPFIRQFAGVDTDWFSNSPYHNVQQWLENIVNGEAFQRVMKKYPRWQPGQRACLFPA